MSKFSNKIHEAILESGQSLATLSQRCSLSVAMLYKIQAGTRLPEKTEKIQGLVDALHTTPAKSEELMREYKIERIGREKYECVEAAGRFVRAISQCSPQILRLPQSAAMPGDGAVTGEVNVRLAVQAMLWQETQRENGVLRILLPPTERHTMECLYSALSYCAPSFSSACHLFTLAATVGDEAIHRNVSALESVIAASLTVAHYEPMYCYQEDDALSLFPYAILSNAAALLLGADLSYAFYTESPELVGVHILAFDALRKKYRPLFRATEASLESYLESFHTRMKNGYEAEHTKSVDFAFEPCVLPCLKTEAIAKYLPPEVCDTPLFRTVVQEYFTFCASLHDVHYFTMEGLRHFLRTGRIPELPSKTTPALHREDILQTMDTFLQRAESGLITPYILKENIFGKNPRAQFSFFDGNLTFVCEVEARSQTLMDMDERSLPIAIEKMIELMQELDQVYTREESIRMVQHAVEEYRSGVLQ